MVIVYCVPTVKLAVDANKPPAPPPPPLPPSPPPPATIRYCTTIGGNGVLPVILPGGPTPIATGPSIIMPMIYFLVYAVYEPELV
jgi:hypothetical protein